MPILWTRGQRLRWLETRIFLMMYLIPETTNGDKELIKLQLLLTWVHPTEPGGTKRLGERCQCRVDVQKVKWTSLVSSDTQTDPFSLIAGMDILHGYIYSEREISIYNVRLTYIIHLRAEPSKHLCQVWPTFVLWSELFHFRRQGFIEALLSYDQRLAHCVVIVAHHTRVTPHLQAKRTRENLQKWGKNKCKTFWKHSNIPGEWRAPVERLLLVVEE